MVHYYHVNVIHDTPTSIVEHPIGKHKGLPNLTQKKKVQPKNNKIK